jgi:phosphohistidine phosphatase
MSLTGDKKKVLLILRHAKSSLKYGDIPDHERPLNKRGKKQAHEMGILLKELQLVPDYVISSTAKRAVDTAKSVAEFCGYEKEINHDSLLYQASAEQYAKVLSVIPDDYHRVLIVGHNPAVEDLVEKLTNMIELMKTCSLAQIDINAKSWRDLASERNNNTLVNVWHPTAKDE